MDAPALRVIFVLAFLTSHSHRGGPLLLGILKESAPGETRVALLPENLKNLVAQGITVLVQSGAGLGREQPTRPTSPRVQP